MKREYIGTMPTKKFIADLACGRFDKQGDAITTVVVATSYHSDAEIIRKIANHRHLGESVLVVEFDDVSNPQRPTAISEETALEIYSFLSSQDVECARFLFVCDGATSRSAAMLCAWMRLCGEDDLPAWVDGRKYSPNVLVYSRLLAAGGVKLESQINERELLKEMVLNCRISGHRSHVRYVPEEAWQQIRNGVKCCELLKRNTENKIIASGDLIAFSMVGYPDDFVVARTTECRVIKSVDELMHNDEILDATDRLLVKEAFIDMREAHGDESYEAVFLDVNEWTRHVNESKHMSKNLLDGMRSTTVMRDYFMDGMK